MTNAEATRAAREATVSDERHLLPETLTIESRSRRKHFTHAWTALGAFVANDDDGTLGNLTVLDGGKSLFLAIKNTCGTTELQAMHTRNLDDCAIRSKASLQTDRSEEHTSELPSLMRITYAVFCLKKKTIPTK